MLCVLGGGFAGDLGDFREVAKKLFICVALRNLDRNIPIL